MDRHQLSCTACLMEDRCPDQAALGGRTWCKREMEVADAEANGPAHVAQAVLVTVTDA